MNCLLIRVLSRFANHLTAGYSVLKAARIVGFGMAPFSLSSRRRLISWRSLGGALGGIGTADDEVGYAAGGGADRYIYLA
jgi:hypothetical protein